MYSAVIKENHFSFSLDVETWKKLTGKKWKATDPAALTLLVHNLPARLEEIIRLKRLYFWWLVIQK